MSKEPKEIEKIAEFILPIKEGNTWVNWKIAVEIAKDIYDAGYRLIPELKVLSDEEIQCLDGRCMLPCTEYDRQVAQAQLTKAIPIIRKARDEEIKRVVNLIPSFYSQEIFTESLEDITEFLKGKGLTDIELTSVSGVLARLGWETAIYQVNEILDIKGEG